MGAQQSSETLVVLELIKELESIQDDPCVGLFWYDPDENELFGVCSSISTGLPFKPNALLKANARTGDMSHSRVWERESRREKDPRFKASCDSLLRGRVVEIENDGYKVYTGDWIKEHPSTKRLILDEFQLPEDKTEFIRDMLLVDLVE